MTNLPKKVHLVDGNSGSILPKHIYDNICKKTFEEAKNPFINNIANGDKY
jgi:hypothetical protein